MKLMKRMAAALLCITVTSSLAAASAFAVDSTGNTTELQIDAKAIACGYSGDHENDLYNASEDRIRLGGSYSAGQVGSLNTDVYPVAGGDAIVYNQKDNLQNRDTRVSYLRFELPEDVTSADTYTLTMTTDGFGHQDRTQAMDIYAGIADMNTPVVSNEQTGGITWTTINWTTRPVVYNVSAVLTNVNITPDSNIEIDLSETLMGQKAGTVTVVLLSKATNSNEMSDSYFKDVTITRTTTAEPEDIVEELSPVEKITDDTSDADSDSVGFVGHVKVTGTSQIGFNVSNDSANVDWIFDTEITDATVVYGLVITDLSESGLAVDDITATYLQ